MASVNYPDECANIVSFNPHYHLARLASLSVFYRWEVGSEVKSLVCITQPVSGRAALIAQVSVPPELTLLPPETQCSSQSWKSSWRRQMSSELRERRGRAGEGGTAQGRALRAEGGW